MGAVIYAVSGDEAGVSSIVSCACNAVERIGVCMRANNHARCSDCRFAVLCASNPCSSNHNAMPTITFP
jgi:hypothetical protein